MVGGVGRLDAGLQQRRRLGHDHGPTDRGRYQGRIGQADEVDPPCSIPVAIGDLGRDLLRESSLARAAGPCEGDEPVLGE